MLPTSDVDVHIPLRAEQVGVSPGGVTCAEAKRQKMQQYSKKKRPYDTMDAAKAKGSPKDQLRPCFLVVAPQPTVRSSPKSTRKSRYLLDDGVWRGLQVFLSSTGACRTTRFGSHAYALRTPNSCAPPFGVSRTEFCSLYSTQHSPGHAGIKFSALPSSIFHLAHCARQSSADDSEHFRERQQWQR
jgi:hypothetical protein